MDHSRSMPIKIHSRKAGKFLPGFIKTLTLRVIVNNHPAIRKIRGRNLEHQAAMQTVNNHDIKLFIQAVEGLPHKGFLWLKLNRRTINLGIAPRNTLDFLNPARVCLKGSHVSGYPPPQNFVLCPQWLSSNLSPDSQATFVVKVLSFSGFNQTSRM